MKHIIRFSLCILLLLSGITGAQSGNRLPLYDGREATGANARFEDFIYSDIGPSITITRCREDAAGAVIIPSVIGGKPVTRIASNAFSRCHKMTSVTIPEGVVAVEDWAFSGCIQLTQATFPVSIKSIGKQAFSACYKLNDVTFPKGLESIGSWAFSSCKSLVRVAIPSSVTSIGREAFKGCWALLDFTVDPANPNYSSLDGLLLNKTRTVLTACPAGLVGECEIPEGVVSIEAFAFYQCNSLVSVVIPPSTTIIGESGFQSSRSIVGVVIPEGVKSIGHSAFGDCRSLASVLIPSSVSNIPENAFKGCSGMNEVTISQGVKSIESSAFSFCSSLTTIMLPATVNKIEGSAFANCKNLLAITVEAENKNFSSEGGMLLNKSKTQLIKCPAGIGNESVVPGGVENIGPSAFADCNRLETIIVPKGVKSIAELSFIRCRNLSMVTISSTVKNIGRSAFDNCKSLRSAVFLGDAPIMGEGVFSYTAESFKIVYTEGASGFTSPFWKGYSSDAIANSKR